MKNISEFVKDSNGQFSSARLVFLTGSLWAMVITTIIVLKDMSNITNGIAFFSAVEGILTGVKLGQKPMEKLTNAKNIS